MASKSVPVRKSDPIPALPTYALWGEKQPPEFSQGALAVVKLLERIEQNHGEEEDVLTEAFCTDLSGLLAKDGKFAIGALATTCAYIVARMTSGEPPLEIYVPFSETWAGDNFEFPPEDCMFFDVDGVPYSVDPSLMTFEWRGEKEFTVRNVNAIRGRATPITRAQFDAMRWKAGLATRNATRIAKEQAAEARASQARQP